GYRFRQGVPQTLQPGYRAFDHVHERRRLTGDVPAHRIGLQGIAHLAAIDRQSMERSAASEYRDGVSGGDKMAQETPGGDQVGPAPSRARRTREGWFALV